MVIDLMTVMSRSRRMELADEIGRSGSRTSGLIPEIMEEEIGEKRDRGKR